MAQGRGLKAMTSRVKLSKRTWRIIGIVAGVVALAAVVLVSSALSRPQASSPATSVALKQVESETLTDQALQALSRNDTDTAQTLLKRAVALNPQNQRAVTALATITQATSGSTGSGSGSTSGGTTTSKPSGTSTTGSTSSSTGSTNPTSTTNTGDAKPAIETLLPITAAGFTVLTPVVWGPDAEVAGEMTSKPSVRVVWSVHDRTTDAKAREFITDLGERAYPQNSTTATIDGASAYVGSDGSRFIVTVYNRGPFVFEALVSLPVAQTDLSPYLSIAQDAAKAFPDKP